MRARRILFWSHLFAGSAAGIVILIMCVTGIALAFERQINRVADRASQDAVSPQATRLPIEALLAALPNRADRPSSVTVSADPREPVAFAFGRDRILFVDPYSGKYLGQSSSASRAFFRTMELWHRALGSELHGRGPGRAIADAANLVFLFLVPSGFVLWWPRRWRPQRLRTAALFRRNLSGRAALWNIHNVVGLWCALPLFLIVLTGVIMSYGWANSLLYKMSGSEPPVDASARPTKGEHRSRKRVAPEEESLPLSTLFERAEKQLPGWRTVAARWTPNSPGVQFVIDEGDGGQPQKRSQLTLDRFTGATKRWEPFESYSTGRRWRAWARFLHTGALGGLMGQIVSTVAVFGGAALVVTGLGMAWIRLRAMGATKAVDSGVATRS